MAKFVKKVRGVASIYLDNHSTTRVDPRVVQAMLPTFDSMYANAGSVTHEMGIEAAQLVEDAGGVIARAIGCVPRELVFTSGATESNNLAIFGYCTRRFSAGHIISMTTEHKAVIDPLKRMERLGFRVTWLRPADQAGRDERLLSNGLVDLHQFENAIESDTILATIMLANNEIGVIQPIAEIAAICRKHNIVLHTDATQAVGTIPVDVNQLDVDLLSFSAHKFYGPKGIGGLFVRQGSRRIRLASQIEGGGQQYGVRSGTLNVTGIVGMAKAIQLASEEMESGESERKKNLRDRLYRGLCRAFGDLPINGPDWRTSDGDRIRLPGNLNCQFPGFEGQTLMMLTPDLAVSSGSACTAANPEPSHVLKGLGLTDDEVRSSIRFGIGRFNNDDEIDRAVAMLEEAVRRHKC